MLQFSGSMPMHRFILIGPLVAALLAAGCPEPKRDRAEQAMRDGKRAQSLRMWESLGRKGNAEAQYRAGNMYLIGQGTAKNQTNIFPSF